MCRPGASFEALESWPQTHFVNVEKIAREAGFDFPSHKPVQQHSLKELRRMRDELIAELETIGRLATRTNIRQTA